MIEARQPGYLFEMLDRRAGPRLGEINRDCPIQADFTFYFDRGEDFFAWPDRWFQSHRYIGIRKAEELVGYGMVALDRRWTGAAFDPVLYLGDFRILPRHRRFNLGQQAAELLGDELPGEVGYGYCLVKRGNQPVEWLLRTHRAAEWLVRPLCGFSAVNLILGAPWPGRSRGVRRATPSDAGELARTLQRAWNRRLLAPELSAEELARDLDELQRTGAGCYYLAERRGRLSGALRVWYSDAVRRTVVLGFSRRGQLLRLGFAAASHLLRDMAPLPRPGQAFHSLTLHQVAIPDRDPAILRELLLAVLRDHQGAGYHLAHLGFVDGDPLRRAVRFLPAHSFDSEIHLIRRRGLEAPGTDGLPWVDLARI